MSSFPEKLADRYRRFHHRHFLPKAEEYEELATHGQNPEAMVISCSDSRVDPADIGDFTQLCPFRVKSRRRRSAVATSVFEPFTDLPAAPARVRLQFKSGREGSRK